MDIAIRPATQEDFDFIYDIYMGRESNEFLVYELMNKADFAKEYLKLLSGHTMFMVTHNNEQVGTYRLVPKDHRQKTTAYLGGFGIASNHLRKGYGSQMLQFLIAQAVNNGIHRIELTVSDYNTPAISLYQKNGFVIEGLMRESHTIEGREGFGSEYLMAVIL